MQTTFNCYNIMRKCGKTHDVKYCTIYTSTTTLLPFSMNICTSSETYIANRLFTLSSQYHTVLTCVVICSRNYTMYKSIHSFPLTVNLSLQYTVCIQNLSNYEHIQYSAYYDKLTVNSIKSVPPNPSTNMIGTSIHSTRPFSSNSLPHHSTNNFIHFVQYLQIVSRSKSFHCQIELEATLLSPQSNPTHYISSLHSFLQTTTAFNSKQQFKMITVQHFVS